MGSRHARNIDIKCPHHTPSSAVSVQLTETATKNLLSRSREPLVDRDKDNILEIRKGTTSKIAKHEVVNFLMQYSSFPTGQALQSRGWQEETLVSKSRFVLPHLPGGHCHLPKCLYWKSFLLHPFPTHLHLKASGRKT